MRVTVDDETRTLTIGEVRYAYDLFTALSFSPPGTIIEILRRSDGTVVVKRRYDVEESDRVAKVMPLPSNA